MIHRGEIVEKIVRRSGYSLTKLAEKLDISRNTLYNKFKNANLPYRFMMEIGNVLYYDFTIDFPEMKEQPMEEHVIPGGISESAGLCRMKAKYVHLLEKYTQLLEILVKMANKTELSSLHQEIQRLIEQIEQEEYVPAPT